MKRSVAYVLIAISAIAFAGCQTSRSEQIGIAKKLAGDNVGEIEKILDHYDDEREEAAEYVVAAMPGLYSRFGAPMDTVEKLYRLLNEKNYWGFTIEQRERGQYFCSLPLRTEQDLKVIRSDYIISHIDDAWQQWKSRKWNKNLPFDLFCELILPYRIGDEKFTDWRKPYRNWAGGLSDSLSNITNSVDAALAVSDKFGRAPFNPRFSTPHRTALNLLEAPVGICREDCDRTVYAMRAHGVPVTVDELLVSPDYGGNHQWNVVYDTDDKIYRLFDNRDYKPTRDSIHYDQRRRGKVYRHMFAIQSDRLEKYKKAPHAPAYLTNPRLKDVTEEYYGENEIEISAFKKEKENYLGIFSPDGMKPIDIGENKNGKVLFRNIEPNLVYFPISPKAEKSFYVNGFPFLLAPDGRAIVFEPNEKKMNRVRLSRKMPIGFLQKGRMKMIDSCYVESSPYPSGPWKTIDTIRSPYSHSFNRIDLKAPLKDRYLRIMAPEGRKRVEIGEFIASSDSVATKRAVLFALDSDGKRPNRKKLTDGDLLVWYTYKPKPDDGGIVLRVDSSDEINYIFMLPHNDDNFVVPGDEYELLYFCNNGRKSLGKKVSDNFFVDFEAPDNAVLWLRNRTKGDEEQVFLWRDGRQLFSVDLDGYIW